MYAAVSVLIAAVDRDSNDADVSDDMPLLLAYVVPVSCTRLPPEMSEEWFSAHAKLMHWHVTSSSFHTVQVSLPRYTLIRQNQSRPG